MCHYVEGNASQMPPAIMCLRPKPSLWMIQRSSCSRRAKVRTRTGQRGSGFTPGMGALGPEQRRPLYGISSPPAEAQNIPLNIWKPTRALLRRMHMLGIMTHTEQVACTCQVIHGPCPAYFFRPLSKSQAARCGRSRPADQTALRR